MSMRLYDPKNNRLIYLAEHATPDFWDRHWETKTPSPLGGEGQGEGEKLRQEITRKHHDFLVLPVTRDYLSPGSRVLEGGCGTGVHVYNLQRHGFASIGIDNAPETVRRAKEAVPEMDIREGDVRALPFPDNHFDGYWSIGVIEHFWNGYDEVLHEMRRVLKPGGYLFLTFPYMSPLRRWRAKREKYPVILSHPSVILNEVKDPVRITETPRDSSPASPVQNDVEKNFYQFALDHEHVAKTFEQNGFELIEEKPFDGWNGLTNEIKSTVLNRVTSPAKGWSAFSGKFIRLAIDFLARPFAGHAVLLVLKKKTLR